MLLRYKKITDEYTTWDLIEPDYNLMPEGESLRVTELCSLEGFTYVHIPESLSMPENQFSNVEKSFETVKITEELLSIIIKTSPHVKLSMERCIGDIDSLYTVKEKEIICGLKNKAKDNSGVLSVNDQSFVCEYDNWLSDCASAHANRMLNWELVI